MNTWFMSEKVDFTNSKIDPSVEFFFDLEEFEQISEIRGSILTWVIFFLVPFQLLVLNLTDSI